MSDLTVAVFFTQGTGAPAIGLALGDIDLYLTAQNRATGVDAVVWNGAQNPTEEIDNVGAYIRIYAGADLDTYNYFARGNYTTVFKKCIWLCELPHPIIFGKALFINFFRDFASSLSINKFLHLCTFPENTCY